jgi:transglutaminase-like putative cysteine protease
LTLARRFITTVFATGILFVGALLLTSCEGGGGGSGISGPPRDTTPVVLAVSTPGAQVVNNSKATLDYSNIADGYFCVKSKLGGTKVKVLVNVSGAQYQYTIVNTDSFITIPLSAGSGSYAVGVWENVKGDSYAAVFSQNLNVTLTDEFTPFLYPSQYVNFAAGDASSVMSEQLASGSVTDVDVLNKIYTWVCDNVTYDRQKAVTVASGYLPNNAETINTKTGICFDYAVLTASMLRAQRVPVKLVIGYAGSAYHAWMQVYCTQTGKVYSYSFNGNGWQRMDPTFDAVTKGAQDLSAIIGNGTNYQPMFYY